MNSSAAISSGGWERSVDWGTVSNVNFQSAGFGYFTFDSIFGARGIAKGLSTKPGRCMESTLSTAGFGYHVIDG
uniref:Uncharacterized protein n=1 Tax=Candidatus Kentrum sp. FW TaxID=2126338 RepID=A0A450SCG6_9GAMM|nr:MAG: hypothetical protein BECKFW1821A_GA0114235_10263 [Candidatus Kentron sp. FW]